MLHKTHWVESKLQGAQNPTGRLGHSLSYAADNVLLFGGFDGKVDENGHPTPSDQVFKLKFRGDGHEWVECPHSGPAPPSRSHHSATPLDDKRVVVFGGMQSSFPSVLLNDMWLLDTESMQWTKMQVKTDMESKSDHLQGRIEGSIEEYMGAINGTDYHERCAVKARDFKAAASVVGNSFDRASLTQKNGLATPMTSEGLHSYLVGSVLSMVPRADEVSVKGAPQPRCGHSLTLVGDNLLVLFGGHGGSGFRRRALNDVHVYNIQTGRWTELRCQGDAPAARCGHGAFAKDNKLYIFGGWNGEQAFNDMFVLDVSSKDWSDLDFSWSVPRWNFCSEIAHAIPAWKLFVFGGTTENGSEGRAGGKADNKLFALELGQGDKFSCKEVEALPFTGEPTGRKSLGVPGAGGGAGAGAGPGVNQSGLGLPGLGSAGSPGFSLAKSRFGGYPGTREHGGMMYDRKESRLVLFGGFSTGGWMNDVWTMDVSSIVGPPYAVAEVVPNFSSVQGGKTVKIKGTGFKAVAGASSARVKFVFHDENSSGGMNSAGMTSGGGVSSSGVGNGPHNTAGLKVTKAGSDGRVVVTPGAEASAPGVPGSPGPGMDDDESDSMGSSQVEDFLEVPGIVVDDTTIEVVIPAVLERGPCSCSVFVAIGGKNFTITSGRFTYILGASPATSLIFGPGILDGQELGLSSMFYVRCRDARGQNMIRGGERLHVKISQGKTVLGEFVTGGNSGGITTGSMSATGSVSAVGSVSGSSAGADGRAMSGLSGGSQQGSQQNSPSASPSHSNRQVQIISANPEPVIVRDLDNGLYVVSYSTRGPESSGEPGGSPDDEGLSNEVEISVRLVKGSGEGDFGATSAAGPAGSHVSPAGSHVRASPMKVAFVKPPGKAKARANEFVGPLVSGSIVAAIKQVEEHCTFCEKSLSVDIPEGPLKDESVTALIGLRSDLAKIHAGQPAVDLILDTVSELLIILELEGVSTDKSVKHLNALLAQMARIQQLVSSKEREIAPCIDREGGQASKKVSSFEETLKSTASNLKAREPYYGFKSSVSDSLARLEAASKEISTLEEKMATLKSFAESFGYTDRLGPSQQMTTTLREEWTTFKALWEFESLRVSTTNSFLQTKRKEVKYDDLEEQLKALSKKLRELKVDRKSEAYVGVQDQMRKWLLFAPLAGDLKDNSMRARHWESVYTVCGKSKAACTAADPLGSTTMTLGDLWDLGVFKYADAISDVTDQAKQEAKMERVIERVSAHWETVKFTSEAHKGSNSGPDKKEVAGAAPATGGASSLSSSSVNLVKLSDENFETLEENQVAIQNMFSSRFLSTFEAQVVSWQKSLATISEVCGLMADVQKSWSFLESLFVHSEEVKKELPRESAHFVNIDETVRSLLTKAASVQLVKTFCSEPGLGESLERLLRQLSVCEKALNDFMDGKRRAFPRFFFVSTSDLLDILSNGNNPARIIRHMSKVFQAVNSFALTYPDGEKNRPHAVSMDTCVGKEDVTFPTSLPLVGKVEMYLGAAVEHLRGVVRHYAKRALEDYVLAGDSGRPEWVKNKVEVAQTALLMNNMAWVEGVEKAFEEMINGNRSAMSDCLKRSSALLLDLIRMTQTQLTARERQKLMCMVTLDAHNRDIIEKLHTENVVSASAFQWQAQLKAKWDKSIDDAVLHIADASFRYGHEYLGNGPRLVVTPLTDRIYVTATQALHLHMGCAPAGPAGTGKTETTKDLANAVAKACYVFNGSPEMDYRTMGNIYKGLASSGSWGCFDEFNRLVPGVLSVCTVQFKAICDALRAKQQRFILQGDEISLDPTVGVFITMNPGYLGRSELPEGLKALFRPITVMVPDFALIMENMFMAEGFLEAKALAKKFSTLYFLCADLLSKSKQYDWGMRAIKSVLVVAGSFKRADASLTEEAVLLRALRDTNVAKIDGDDLKIFQGLLGDLFPGVSVTRAVDSKLQQAITSAMDDLGYSSDPDGYVALKISQLVELLVIRHCVFLMGRPGSFKSCAWKVLAKAREKLGEKCTAVDLNPKSVSTQELYGFVNMTTREWQDGILSKTMRSLSQAPDTLPKWIVLDGDLDPNWIESMNSVMDDNKLLTLPSNERIQLKPHMRMIFEIRDLNFATPATVTRAGVIVMSDSNGVQWRCYKSSWLKRVGFSEQVKDCLAKLIDKYVPDTLIYLKKFCRMQIMMVDLCVVQNLCVLLESVLVEKIEKDLLAAAAAAAAASGGSAPSSNSVSASNIASASLDKDTVEMYFIFCLIWAASSPLDEMDGVDYRKQFSTWWRQDMKGTAGGRLPGRGSIYDYFVSDNKMDEWANIVPSIEYSSETPMSLVTVPTAETVAISFFMKHMIKAHQPVMLIGSAGVGKTQICRGVLRSLNPELYTSQTINMNYYTDSSSLQALMEAPLEKKAGRLYAPPGRQWLVYFIDDLNMPALDQYNTQSAIALLRQGQDYKHWYDRQKIALKDIGNTQLLACMNPTAGSFTVDERLQRHFWTCNVSFPELSSFQTIYSTFMKGHFERLKFKPAVQEITGSLIKAVLALHGSVSKTFRKTASNFHYEFNIRHLSGVFGGLLQARPQDCVDADKLVCLWMHESLRVYADRLVSESDVRKMKGLLSDLAKKMFVKSPVQKFFVEKNPEPLIFAPFAKGSEEKCYDRIASMERLSELLVEALKEYNEVNPAMDLVLFEDAMRHVCRVSRIISNPGGHALLVGVGGSGRQSLGRLAGFMCKYTLMTLVISGSYGLSELKTDLMAMCQRAGVKDEGVLFMLTDSQIVNERFLVSVNDLLATGEVSDLYAAEDKDGIRNAVRSAARANGVPDTPETLWQFFVERVKKNLHVALCFSPVGESMRSRARRFPALINCTVIDWFQPWPQEALKSVASKFLAPVEALGSPDSQLRKAIADYIPFSFDVVTSHSKSYLQSERRYAYTTPKSFLELIKLYGSMVEARLGEMRSKKEALASGLEKLRQTEVQVGELEKVLKDKSVVVAEAVAAAEAFAAQVGTEKAKVDEEARKAAVEQKNCADIQAVVSAQAKSCEDDLAKAIPLVQKAEAALDVLNKKDFQELKSFANPPPGVDEVCVCCLHLLATLDSTVTVDKRGKAVDPSWKSALKMMANPEKFLESLKGFKKHIDSSRVPKQNIESARPLTKSEFFTPESMAKKSKAAAGLCEWVINILLYYDVVITVEPKRQALREATEQLRQANEKLEKVQALVAELEAKLAKLVEQYDKATAERDAVVAEAQVYKTKLDMAHRLIGALGANGVLWEQTIGSIDSDMLLIPGDVVVACSFVSYLGVFSRPYREACLKEFVAFLQSRQVRLSPSCDPLKMLASEADIARWATQGLPSDRVSSENGAIMNSSARWCIMVDPQLQGVQWVKNKESGNGLKCVRLGQPKMLQIFEAAIESGYSVLIENMGDSIDPVLAPIIGRNTIKRGRNRYVKLGDKEINYDPKFRLFMHTTLSNPHYPPELQAECTLINFTVTEQGLEEQLLLSVIRLERPDLAKQKEDLVASQNEYKVKLAELEALLLSKFAAAQGDVLEDVQLVTSLEQAKFTSDEVKSKVEVAKQTETRINAVGEHYRVLASRGALIFFLLMDLAKIHSFYRYSLESFVGVCTRAIESVNASGSGGAAGSGGALGMGGSVARRTVSTLGGATLGSGPGSDRGVGSSAASVTSPMARESSVSSASSVQGGMISTIQGAGGNQGLGTNQAGASSPSLVRRTSEASLSGSSAQGGNSRPRGQQNEGAGPGSVGFSGPDSDDAQSVSSQQGGDRSNSSDRDRGSNAVNSPVAGQCSGGQVLPSGGQVLTSGSTFSSEAASVYTGRDLQQRIKSLLDAMTKAAYVFACSSILDRHRLVFSALLCLQIQMRVGAISPVELDVLVRSPLDASFAGGSTSGSAGSSAGSGSSVPGGPGGLPDSLRAWMTDVQWSKLRYLENNIPFFKTGIVTGQTAPAGGPPAGAASGQSNLAGQNNSAGQTSMGAGSAQIPQTICYSIEHDALAWKRWAAEEKAEQAELPRTHKQASSFHKLLLVQVLRPDRLSSALSLFVSDRLGPAFIEKPTFSMERTYQSSSKSCPIFFVLFPGTDPTRHVEQMARSFGFTEGNGKFVNISMGQGQEQVALNALQTAAKDGGWIMLQNIHLMDRWLKQLERALESIGDSADDNFRCILSSEPPPLPLMETIPESILQRCVKVVDEAPEDMKSNLRRAWGCFNQELIDSSPRPRELKACLFGLSFFHAVVVGRKRFGPQGWSKGYPFNEGDLTICSAVLQNYLKHEQIPWPDLCYIFGEIMYGGHITDRWDRRTCNTYLNMIMVPELFTGLPLCQGFRSPDPGKMEYSTYSKFIEERLPVESPQMFGLHPNAEIKFATAQASSVFEVIQTIVGSTSVKASGTSSAGVSGASGSSSAASPAKASGADDSSPSGEVTDQYAEVAQLVTMYTGQIPQKLDLIEIRSRVLDWSPYVIVSLQESERMNALLTEIRRSLAELEMGVTGQLNMSEAMENLARSLVLNKVPSGWEALAYYSLKPLSSWFADLILRAKQLVEWTRVLGPMKSLWISGLFNPMSYLTAVIQVTARQHRLPLDSMTNRFTFTNYKSPEIDVTTHALKGVYVHGMFLEGASWEFGKDEEEGYLTEAKPKVIRAPMPVVNVYAVSADHNSWDQMYKCPVYVTSQRGPSYLTTANVRMEPDDKEQKWVIAGAALLLADD